MPGVARLVDRRARCVERLEIDDDRRDRRERHARDAERHVAADLAVGGRARARRRARTRGEQYDRGAAH
jgi:hypothetical protein